MLGLNVPNYHGYNQLHSSLQIFYYNVPIWICWIQVPISNLIHPMYWYSYLPTFFQFHTIPTLKTILLKLGLRTRNVRRASRHISNSQSSVILPISIHVTLTRHIPSIKTPYHPQLVLSRHLPTTKSIPTTTQTVENKNPPKICSFLALLGSWLFKWLKVHFPQPAT